MSTRILASYPILKDWPKEAGKRPTSSLLDIAHRNASVIPGSGDALVVAMGLREEGVTQDQVKKVLGRPHRNKFRALLGRGQAKASVSALGRYKVYRIRLKRS